MELEQRVLRQLAGHHRSALKTALFSEASTINSPIKHRSLTGSNFFPALRTWRDNQASSLTSSCHEKTCRASSVKSVWKTIYTLSSRDRLRFIDFPRSMKKASTVKKPKISSIKLLFTKAPWSLLLEASEKSLNFYKPLMASTLEPSSTIRNFNNARKVQSPCLPPRRSHATDRTYELVELKLMNCISTSILSLLSFLFYTYTSFSYLWSGSRASEAAS